MSPSWTTVAAALAGGAGALAVAPLVIPVPPLTDTVDPRELADPDARFTEVRGIAVHHVETGGGAPTFLLLHNFFGSTFSFRRLLGPLGERGRAVAYDRPGFGLTQRPTRPYTDGNPYTRASNAALAVGLLDALDVDRTILVGSSAGATVAFEVALADPERVEALVLISPAVNGDVGPPAPLRPLLRTPQARRLGPWWLRRLARQGIDRYAANLHDRTLATEADLDGYRRPVRARDWDVALFETMVAEPPPHLGPRLREIIAPALVVNGAQDTTVHPHLSRRTAAALGDGRYVEIPRCGHLAAEERPDAVLAAIDAFLGGLGYA